MVSVAQNNLCLDVVQVLRIHRLNRAVSADRHKYGRFDFAVVQFQRAASGMTVFLCKVNLSIGCIYNIENGVRSRRAVKRLR